MKPRLGFVLLTHSNPEQSLFLCKRLNAVFDTPPIVMHHDFGQADLDRGRFPENVSFVEDWVHTNWGRFPVVEGVHRALRVLYRESDPDWFVYLSGADYPIKAKDALLHDLDSSGCDAFLDYREIHASAIPMPSLYDRKSCFEHPGWISEGYKRYMSKPVGFYAISSRLGWDRHAIHLRGPLITRLFTPFRADLKCYGGDAWFTANRKAAHVLLGDSKLVRDITAHLRERRMPEECYYQTVLLNTPGIKVARGNLRYTDWTGCFAHPRLLEESDFAAMLASGDHFARKFRFDPAMLEKVDRLVDAQVESREQALQA